MNSYPDLFQSFLSYSVLERAPWPGLAPAQDPRCAMPGVAHWPVRLRGAGLAHRVVLRLLNRTIAMLQSWEAALAGAQPEDRSQGGVTEDASNKIVDVSGVTAGSVPDVSGRESIPSLPVSQYTCPHCRIHLVVGGGGSGAGAHELRSVPALPEPSEVVGLVEKALRRLFDFAYLGESPLASWEITRRLAAERQRSEAGAETPVPGAVTHVERGKALYVLLVQALKTLRPDGKPPDRHAVPRREWYNYLILYESYVEGELNRNIMARLYIGEGTFNRARRAALEAVARTLLEMEAAARQEPSEGE